MPNTQETQNGHILFKTVFKLKSKGTFLSRTFKVEESKVPLFFLLLTVLNEKWPCYDFSDFQGVLRIAFFSLKKFVKPKYVFLGIGCIFLWRFDINTTKKNYEPHIWRSFSVLTNFFNEGRFFSEFKNQNLKIAKITFFGIYFYFQSL